MDAMPHEVQTADEVPEHQPFCRKSLTTCCRRGTGEDDAATGTCEIVCANSLLRWPETEASLYVDPLAVLVSVSFHDPRRAVQILKRLATPYLAWKSCVLKIRKTWT